MTAAAGTSTLEQLDSAVRYNRWVFDRLRPAVGDRVLDVGCGTGAITQFLVDRSLVVAVDIEPNHIRAAQQRLQSFANVVVRLHDLTASIEELRPYHLDSAISANVLEHIADDLAALQALHALLEPGSRLGLLVPAMPFLMSPFDRSIGHYRRYTRRNLREKLEAADFAIEELRYTNPVGALGWLMFATLLRRRQLGALPTYDRLVPVWKALDRLRLPLGLSLVAIVRRR